MINLKINGQTLQDIELIIFDKDGTLFELHSYWSVISNKRAEYICMNIGIPFTNEIRDYIAYIMGVDNKNKCMRPDSMIGVNKRSDIEYRVFEQLMNDGYIVTFSDIRNAFTETDVFLENTSISDYKNCAQITTPVKGLLDLLKSINNNCKCAVLSYDRTNNIYKCLKSVKIEEHFSDVVGGDMPHKPKPDPGGAIQIMERLNIKPGNTLFIGDTLNDILCGANAKCAYVVTKKSELSQLKKIKKISSLIINDFTEIEVIS